MFKRVTYNFFQRVVNKAGVGREVENSRILGQAQQILSKYLGEKSSTFAKPMYVKNRRIFFAIEHSVIADEIKQREQTLIAEINDQLKRPEIIGVGFILR